ncbi:hypothetical protein BU17DRAFT_72230 [Hysterangium stoloniferum]|nr:hypothetical protein BU17DRAFT_72230 [Hysterangium stoloniferum]
MLTIECTETEKQNLCRAAITISVRSTGPEKQILCRAPSPVVYFIFVKFRPPALRRPHRHKMSEIPQASRQRSKLPQGNPAGVKWVQTLLRYRQIAEKMLPGPLEPAKPVAEVPGWRWPANWSGERSWSIYSVLAMPLIVVFALAGQGLTTVARHHHSVALDVVRPTTSTIDELMGKCALRTKLPLQTVIGRHVPAVTVEGMISQLCSAKIDVIGLKKTDNGLTNGMRRGSVSFAKPVSQSNAMLDETPLGPRMQMNDDLFNGLQSKSATLTTSLTLFQSKLQESGYPEKSIAMIEEVDTRQMYPFDVAHWGAGFKDSFPFAATKYNETREVACCLPAVDRCIHLELLSQNACDCLPDAADHVSATTVHMSWFCPSHQDGYLKSQLAVTNNPQWPSLEAHLKAAGNGGVIRIIIPDDPEEEGPAEAVENARSPSKPVSWFCCKNVIIATGDLEFRSSHTDSDLNANRIIGNRTWVVSPVDVQSESDRIGRWFFRSLDTSVLIGSQWKLTLWKLAAQIMEAMLPRGTAQHESVQPSMTLREEMGFSSRSMRLHPIQVTYTMEHNRDKYPPSKNRFKDARARRCMRHKRMRQATDGYGGCILGEGFLRSFDDAAAIARSECSWACEDCQGLNPGASHHIPTPALLRLNGFN